MPILGVRPTNFTPYCPPIQQKLTARLVYKYIWNKISSVMECDDSWPTTVPVWCWLVTVPSDKANRPISIGQLRKTQNGGTRDVERNFEFTNFGIYIRIRNFYLRYLCQICARTDVGIEVSANETRCLCPLLAVDARHFTSRLPWPPSTLSVSDYPCRPRPIPLVLPSVSQSAQFDTSHASVCVEWSGRIHTSQKHWSIHGRTHTPPRRLTNNADQRQ